MKDQILKIAKVKSEKEFYKKYPTEEAFMAKHGKQLRKAAMGTKMVDTQLTQLTDFGNPPIAQNGIHFADALNNAKQNLAKSTQEPEPEKPGIIDTISTIKDRLLEGIMREGGHLPMAQEGGIFNIANAIGGAFTTPGKAATATSPATAASGGFWRPFPKGHPLQPGGSSGMPFHPHQRCAFLCGKRREKLAHFSESPDVTPPHPWSRRVAVAGWCRLGGGTGIRRVGRLPQGRLAAGVSGHRASPRGADPAPSHPGADPPGASGCSGHFRSGHSRKWQNPGRDHGAMDQ
jgi:hypothetical protein